MPSKPPHKRPLIFINLITNRKKPTQHHSPGYKTYICEPSTLHPPPHRTKPHAMSTITPPSFLDDGISLASRLPRGLDTQRVAQWVSRGSVSDASVYTGSFVDDGEDAALRGGGAANEHRAYETVTEKRKQGRERAWNQNEKAAVSGDVRRHVAKIRDLRGKVQVRKVKGREEGEKEKEKERVRVPVPRQWGAFVIKGEDGRIIVVDEEGEFDSGPRGVPSGKQQEQRWVRAASTVEPSSPVPAPASTSMPADQRTVASRSSKRTQTAKRGHAKDEWNSGKDSPRTLTPIPESGEEDWYSPSDKETIGSSTGFMATVEDWEDSSQTSRKGNSHSSRGSIDGRSGWASPSKFPHPYTWTTSRSNSQGRGPKAVGSPAWTETCSSQQYSLENSTGPSSEATWDGFERRRTLSDVSIAGTNSIRSSLVDGRRTGHGDTAKSRRRGTSREAARVDNQHGWEHGSSGRSKARYANGFDEDNATYLNANWGGTPVRVARY